MAIDFYDLLEYGGKNANYYYCVETGERFYENDELFVSFKGDYTFIKIPNVYSDDYKIECIKKFIKLPQNPDLLYLLEIKDCFEFLCAFGEWQHDIIWVEQSVELEESCTRFFSLMKRYTLAKWCNENNIEWTDNYFEDEEERAQLIKKLKEEENNDND